MILHILNSDFGVSNTIGSRALPIAKYIPEKHSIKIYCRDWNKNIYSDQTLTKVVPYGDIIMKVLAAIPIYISKRLSTHKLRNTIFEWFLIRKIKKLDLEKVKIVHSWDYLPKTYKLLKEKNPKIKIIQDVAMALLNALEDVEDKEELWENENLQTPSYFEEAFEVVDFFLVPSDFVKESLIRKSIEKERIKVIPFGVDINKFSPVEKKIKGKFKAAFAGNVNNRKGIKYLIKAWKELDLKNAELNIYGRIYPEVKEYLKNAKKFNIKVHGFVEISKELPKNHIYVFPSLMEGSSKSIYEALACGLPVITTFNSGSIVRDGQEGFIVPIQDIRAINEKINFFYNNRNKIKNFGKKARQRALDYTWEDYGKKVVKVYEEIS